MQQSLGSAALQDLSPQLTERTMYKKEQESPLGTKAAGRPGGWGSWSRRTVSPGRISILSPAGGRGEVLAAWWACQVRNEPLTQGFAQAHK